VVLPSPPAPLPTVWERGEGGGLALSPGPSPNGLGEGGRRWRMGGMDDRGRFLAVMGFECC